ncbi:12153_t:CDS:1, partial [Funneliformis geosporum]
TLQQLVKNAKSHTWAVDSHKPVYIGDAESTLHNKRAYWRKAALGSKKITEMFLANEATKSNTNNTNNDDLTFD